MVHQGDGVRVMVESNSDGYLYVFTTENTGEAKMIYPDPRIDEGRNRILSHVTRAIPSDSEFREKFRWFSFDKVAATERLHFVLARQPRPRIPTGMELSRYCTSDGGACPLQPSTQIWTAGHLRRRNGKFREGESIPCHVHLHDTNRLVRFGLIVWN